MGGMMMETMTSSKLGDQGDTQNLKKNNNGIGNDSEFIKNLDNDIKKTEESLKEMNERFERIKQ
jgi:hypothetical protein